GSETVAKTASVTAYGLTLAGPERVRYGRPAAFHGALVPPDSGTPLVLAASSGVKARTKTRKDGTFAVRLRVFHPGAWTVSLGETASSPPLTVDLIPQLRTSLLGSGARGARLVLAASVRPKNAGELAVTISRGDAVIVDNTFRPPVRIKLDTRRLSTYRIRVAVRPNEGFTNAVHRLRASVVLPRLAY